ncbi:c-type cytochrome [Myroides sp. LJL116]
MKNIYKIVALVGVSVLSASCFNKERPNYQFMPNMYEAVPYETYSEVPTTVFADGMEAQLPAEGSIPRGFEPEVYPNTPEGLAQARLYLKSPLADSEKNLEKGKELYSIYCSVCHGSKGDGKGTLVKNEKFLGVPNYHDRDLTEGGVYQVITYGLNSMGSHANQLTQHERWLVTDYVLKLKSE